MHQATASTKFHHQWRPPAPPRWSLVFRASMASLLSIFLLSLLVLLFFSSTSPAIEPAGRNSRQRHPSAAAAPKAVPTAAVIKQACKATRFPVPCEASLAKSPPNPSPIDLLLAAISAAAQNLKTAQSMVHSILDASAGNPRRSIAANNCIEHLGHSGKRLAGTADALPGRQVKDAVAWSSAALLYQYDCFNALMYVNGTKQVDEAMRFLVFLSQLTSNALSMLAAYERFGSTTSLWAPPQTERDGYWGGDAAACGFDQGENLGGGFPSDLPAPKAKVCKDDGEGCYRTVQEAVNAAPDYGTGRFVIFENAAGPDAHQAVAFRSDSDKSLLEEVEFRGHQDTLYARSLRQFYKSCRITGTVDFVFGNSAAVFQDCLLLVRPRQVNPQKGETNAVTAQGRTDPAQATGFVFQRCVVNGTEEYMELFRRKPAEHKNYLGRPWKEYARTVFLRCRLAALIRPEGWLPWKGDFGLKTLFYGEFESAGPGARPAERVRWSNQIPAAHVAAYSVESFIQGGRWIPPSSSWRPEA